MESILLEEALEALYGLENSLSGQDKKDVQAAIELLEDLPY